MRPETLKCLGLATEHQKGEVVVFSGENPVEKTLGGKGCHSRFETRFYKFISKPECSRM